MGGQAWKLVFGVLLLLVGLGLAVFGLAISQGETDILAIVAAMAAIPAGAAVVLFASAVASGCREARMAEALGNVSVGSGLKTRRLVLGAIALMALILVALGLVSVGPGAPPDDAWVGKVGLEHVEGERPAKLRDDRER